MRRLSALIMMFLLVSLTACQPGALDRRDSLPLADELISEAEQSGELAQAAEAYLNKAESSEGALQAAYYYRAASVSYALEDYPRAAEILNLIDINKLAPADQIEALLLQSEIALLLNQPTAALATLNQVDTANANSEQQQRRLSLKIEAYALNENDLDKALTHLELDPLLSANAQRENREALWASLMALSPQQLDLFNPGHPPAEDSGWFALAYAITAYQNNPEALDVAIENWYITYPNHPADAESYRAEVKPVFALPDAIGHVAVLLPESGAIAGAANAVKQGIIAAHFAQGANRQLTFYDTSQRGGVTEAYRQATSAGASIVIGPLDKQAVQQLADFEPLPIPILALNRISTTQSLPAHFFQFGLAPEDEAVSAANFALKQGYQRALVIGPESTWGERVIRGFEQAWREQGGIVVRSTRYRESQSDFAEIIKPLFALTDSEYRRKSLQNTLSRTLEFEPRRRQDVDFIFMVANPVKGRQLTPQFRFHRSGQLPVLSTSHVYEGTENPRQDIDLNGIIISDIPWLLNQDQDVIYQGLLNQATGDRGSFLRLAAMGVDAYQLIDALTEMNQNQQVFEGVTGQLSIDEAGHIDRQLPQGTFQDGKLQAITETE
ncbi:LppC putative lipoprotein [Methylophaga frappieri]|uniref:LppC putative lipoprotein n=1 Tax=Methylophaga frappieri (strain ATCC BAA-2434 / DSM 25690 / JAM7) TaxID=754477 RepID=I1YGK6_METFJ|nr:penicillin-binding protein activator [Methylophaga frappieri]AFJ02049.1 LppC putative lipoprotein [Methylophaga frappieri]